MAVCLVSLLVRLVVVVLVVVVVVVVVVMNHLCLGSGVLSRGDKHSLRRVAAEQNVVQHWNVPVLNRQQLCNIFDSLPLAVYCGIQPNIEEPRIGRCRD